MSFHNQISVQYRQFHQWIVNVDGEEPVSTPEAREQARLNARNQGQTSTGADGQEEECKGDQCPAKVDRPKPVTLEIRNEDKETMGQVLVYWVNPEDAADMSVSFGPIKVGSSYPIETFVSHTFKILSDDTGAHLAQFTVEPGVAFVLWGGPTIGLAYT